MVSTCPHPGAQAGGRVHPGAPARTTVVGVPTLLTPAQTTAALADLPGWTQDGASLVRTAELASFAVAIAVVTRVADVAEAMDHHPDVDIRWRTVTFRCATHSEGGITRLDVRLATEISALLAAG